MLRGWSVSGQSLGHKERHTVNCNGNGFGQLIAVRSCERRTTAKLVELEILEAGVINIDNDLLEVELVRLRNRFDGNGAWVMLQWEEASVSNNRPLNREHADLGGIELAERHDCIPGDSVSTLRGEGRKVMILL